MEIVIIRKDLLLNEMIECNMLSRKDWINRNKLT